MLRTINMYVVACRGQIRLKSVLYDTSDAIFFLYYLLKMS